MSRIRVLVVEDSLTVRKRLVEVLELDPSFEVVGEAADGQTGIELCMALRPDVITMDLMLPGTSGLAATEYIMAHCPTPILIVSSSHNRGELRKTYEALAAGAVEAFEKPNGTEEPNAWERGFLSTLRIVSRVRVITHPRARLFGVTRTPVRDEHPPPTAVTAAHRAEFELAVIGASTGGPIALVELFKALPHNYVLPTLVVLHIGAPFAPAFAEWLRSQIGRGTSYAVDGEPLTALRNSVRLAPADQHLELRSGRLRITNDPPRHSCRPSVDVLFESVAREHGSRTAACLLTGMGRDGASGLLALRRSGSLTMAQDEASRRTSDAAIGHGAGARSSTDGSVARSQARMTPRVLIVDDSLTVRMDLADAFRAAGFEALLARDAEQARNLIRLEALDLLVLDVILPDADGIAILRELREAEQETGTHLPVILLSTEAEVEDRVRGLRTGADEYVGKPYDVGRVLARAKELVTESRNSLLASAPSNAGPILLIDDSATFRGQIGDALRENGFKVVTASSGEEGLRMAAAERPTAVLVDGILPGIDGATVIRRIRLDAALRSVPCILLTAALEPEAELRALDSGADAFMSKDNDAAMILAKLTALLRRASRNEQPSPTESLQYKKVLAVDDSRTYSAEIAKVLEEEGYEVIVAYSGEAAIELLSVESVDCVILDLVMEGIGGAETCRRIKSSPVLRDLPVIVLTSVEDRATMLEVMAAGADDFISKSTEWSVLKARVRAQLRRRQFEDETRRVREHLLRSQSEAAAARSARELAETRAKLVEQLERKNGELETAYRDLQAAQTQLVQSAKMASLGELVAGVAHEINNPLAFVLAHLDTTCRSLAKAVPDPAQLSPAEKEHWDRANSRLSEMNLGLERIRELVVKLRTFSRLDEGERKIVSVRECVESLLTILSHKLKDRIAVETHFGEPDRLECYPSLLTQAIMNLIANAIDAIDGQGHIAVRTGAGEGGYQIAVSDTGHGIPPENRERVMEPFFTTKPVGEGTGLGLSIAYSIVRKHGGTLQLSEADGGGTRALIWLPLFDPGGPDDAHAIRAETASASRR
jgi:chemotaxis response regulator CheB